MSAPFCEVLALKATRSTTKLVSGIGNGHVGGSFEFASVSSESSESTGKISFIGEKEEALGIEVLSCLGQEALVLEISR